MNNFERPKNWDQAAPDLDIEERRESQKIANEDEISRRNGLVAKFDGGEMSPMEMSELRNLMFRASDLTEEERKAIWNRIDARDKNNKPEGAE